ncbi:HNH endonuclease [Deinococcus multiflagellatus]|uniref:HNH endonuclease n=2 Tax=Deinococcus multiflagellatus TaxID=1656887 RepID=A0ABW1ZKL8_9DEIO
MAQVSQHRWHLGKDGYARTHVRGQVVTLHRFLAGEGREQYKDHKNGDKLDNRRRNLRACSQRENSYNRRRHRNNRSGYKGVTRWKGQWRASIHQDGRQRHLGLYPHPMLAALAYNAAARALFGEYAQLNVLDLAAFAEVPHAAD